MEANEIRLRLRGVPLRDWEAMFRMEADSLIRRDELRLIDSEGQDGSALRAADPSVLAAMIEGGATVLSAVLGALLGAYVAAKKPPVDGNVRVVVRGKSKSVEFVLPNGSKGDDFAARLSGLGTIVEVSIG